MKTTLLKTLHEKCLNALMLIDKAEERRNHWMELTVRHQMTNARNELKLWPCGRPYSGEWSMENCEAEINWYNQKVLPRLENRYNDLLDRITANAIDNFKTIAQ